MPDIFRDWDQPPGQSLDWKEIKKLYERGYAGARYSRKEKELWLASVSHPNAEQVCLDYGFEESASGKLVANWIGVDKTYPGCWPASGQKRGSCVRHAGRNQQLQTLVGEVLAGLPDPVSGKVEEAPKVSPAAQKDGVLAIEPGYHYRGHRSDGWYCAADQRIAIEKCGAVLRRNYPGIADLTTLNSNYAGRYYKESQIPEETIDAFDDHRFRDSTEITEFESLRDLLNRGFGVTSCGSEGWSDKRDENGFSRRAGKWAHAMAVIGCDDRREIHSKYGGPLVLILNSWGPRWNSGGTKVLGTDLNIPLGSFWAKWGDFKRRDIYALAGLNGWERNQLPDYLGGWK